MKPLKITTILPVPSISAAVTQFTALLGCEPTSVSGHDWAQFDIEDTHIALAGGHRTSDSPGLMIKVDDLAVAVEHATALGLEVGEVQSVPYQKWFTTLGPGKWPLTFYQKLL